MKRFLALLAVAAAASAQAYVPVLPGKQVSLDGTNFDIIAPTTNTAQAAFDWIDDYLTNNNARVTILEGDVTVLTTNMATLNSNAITGATIALGTNWEATVSDGTLGIKYAPTASETTVNTNGWDNLHLTNLVPTVQHVLDRFDSLLYDINFGHSRVYHFDNTTNPPQYVLASGVAWRAITNANVGVYNSNTGVVQAVAGGTAPTQRITARETAPYLISATVGYVLTRAATVDVYLRLLDSTDTPKDAWPICRTRDGLLDEFSSMSTIVAPMNAGDYLQLAFGDPITTTTAKLDFVRFEATRLYQE
jgi:hypothetical protein